MVDSSREILPTITEGHLTQDVINESSHRSETLLITMQIHTLTAIFSVRFS